MGGGTGRLPGRDVFYLGFKNCLYGRRDGIFAGSFIPCLHENVSTRDDFTRIICKISIISSRQSGTECLYDKNCPTLAETPVERTRIPLCQDGTKNVTERDKYKRYTCMARSHHPGKRPVPANVPSRLPYKQALIAFLYVVLQLSCNLYNVTCLAYCL